MNHPRTKKHGVEDIPRGNAGCRARGHLTKGVRVKGGIAFQNPQESTHGPLQPASAHPFSFQEESSSVVF